MNKKMRHLMRIISRTCQKYLVCGAMWLYVDERVWTWRNVDERGGMGVKLTAQAQNDFIG